MGCFPLMNLEFALNRTTVLTCAVTFNSFTPSRDLLGSQGKAQETLHARAAQVATEHFGHDVFLRGVVEVSDFCRENCAYCGMRRDNRNLARFRARHDELAELLINHRPASITD